MKIALTAPLRAGKSLAASYISLHYDFQPFAFGDELKDAFHRAFPHVPRNPKPRAHYQKFGQWAREAFGEDVWIDALMPKIAAYLDRHPCDCGNTALKNRVIIDDCRQPNEYKRLKDEGFVFIRITAPAELRIERAKKPAMNSTSPTWSIRLSLPLIISKLITKLRTQASRKSYTRSWTRLWRSYSSN